MEKVILHADMDAFFISVEQIERPELKDKPAAVGGATDRRGVIASASYKAREYGVYASQPYWEAKKRCPGLIIIPCNMEKYIEYSKKINLIFRKFTPLIENVGLDEAYLDITGSLKLFKGEKNLGLKLKNDVYNETGLIVSIGIAENKFLAKISSEINKPDGFFIMPRENNKVVDILKKLPVSKLRGVGYKKVQKLVEKGITKISQLMQLPEELIRFEFGSYADNIIDMMKGIDNSDVKPFREKKSIGRERTLPVDISGTDNILNICMDLIERVCFSMRKEKLKGRTVTVKIRYPNFYRIQKSVSLKLYTNFEDDIFKICKKIIKDNIDETSKIRLIGVSVSNLVYDNGIVQLDLFNMKDNKKQDLINVIDKLKQKYGRDIIKKKLK